MALKPATDGSQTSLAIAREESIKVLPATPVWYPLEPNGYGGLGGATTMVARRPINRNRMALPGKVSNVESSASFNIDVTQKNLQPRAEEFLMATLRTKNEIDEVATISSDTLTVSAGGAAYAEDDLVLLEGFDLSSNNGLKVADTGSDATNVPIKDTLTDASTQDGTISKVGRHFAIETVTVTTVDSTTDDDFTVSGGHDFPATGWGPVRIASSGAVPDGLAVATDYWVIVDSATEFRLASSKANALADTEIDLIDDGTGTITVTSPGVTVDVSGTWPRLWFRTYDPTDLGLIPGEPVLVGGFPKRGGGFGGAAVTQFAAAGNNGPKRARSITTDSIYIDKSAAAMVDAVDGTKTIRIFIPKSIKNEADPDDYVRPVSRIERNMGQPDDSSSDEQAEYVSGCVGGTLAVSFPTADKVIADLSYVGLDTTYADAGALESGTRPALVVEDCFVTATDGSPLSLAIYEEGNEAPDELFEKYRDFNLTIENNLRRIQGDSDLGFDVAVGSLDVTFGTTGFYQVVESQRVIRESTDLCASKWIYKQNAGIVIDMPCVRANGGEASVALDDEITQALECTAYIATSVSADYDHAVMVSWFDYAPTE